MYRARNAERHIEEQHAPERLEQLPVNGACAGRHIMPDKLSVMCGQYSKCGALTHTDASCLCGSAAGPVVPALLPRCARTKANASPSAAPPCRHLPNDSFSLYWLMLACRSIAASPAADKPRAPLFDRPAANTPDLNADPDSLPAPAPDPVVKLTAR